MKNRLITIAAGALISSQLLAGPVYQMNRAFQALSALVPFLTDENKFVDKKNEKFILKKMTDLQSAFKLAKHDALLKEDLFAPSYEVVTANLDDSITSFSKGQKDYAHWRLKELTSNCIDCHSRLPQNYTSSFQNGELSLDESSYDDPYNLGIAYLIVRKYPEAKEKFLRAIQDRYIKKQFASLDLPLRQLLLIDLKILREPDNFKSTVKLYQDKPETPEEIRRTLSEWNKRLEYWQKSTVMKEGLTSEEKAKNFITNEMKRMKSLATYNDAADVDLLVASGLLSQYLFQNPHSAFSAEINFWLGWAEKRLQREHFFGPGDLFLKQCIKRYGDKPVARDCFEEYKESVEFEFTGSGGTSIPVDVQKELEYYRRLLK